MGAISTYDTHIAMDMAVHAGSGNILEIFTSGVMLKSQYPLYLNAASGFLEDNAHADDMPSGRNNLYSGGDP